MFLLTSLLTSSFSVMTKKVFSSLYMLLSRFISRSLNGPEIWDIWVTSNSVFGMYWAIDFLNWRNFSLRVLNLSIIWACRLELVMDCSCWNRDSSSLILSLIDDLFLWWSLRLFSKRNFCWIFSVFSFWDFYSRACRFLIKEISISSSSLMVWLITQGPFSNRISIVISS